MPSLSLALLPTARHVAALRRAIAVTSARRRGPESTLRRSLCLQRLQRLQKKLMLPGTCRPAAAPTFAAAAAAAALLLLYSSLPPLRGLSSAAMAATAAPGGAAASSGEGVASETIVVYVTVPNNDVAKNLARSIVEKQLAACVNRIPGLESTYWWRGKIETDAEQLLMMKTRRSLLPKLAAYVKANHPYELPEVIGVPITGGSEKYIAWIKDNTLPE